MNAPPSAPVPGSTLEDLYRANHGWMQRWLQRKLGNASDAAELAQDVFVSLLSTPRVFNDAEHARAYLGRMSRSACVDFWRRRRIEQAYLEVLAAQPEHQVPSLEHQAIILETLGQLQAMLERMPKRVAEAFCLAQLQGMKQREIAEQLGVSERSVNKYLAQAMYQCLLLEVELDVSLT
ncbi:putative RNA polymerase sigma factor FecI [Pseudomonas reidholzensis]|uniref:Putative RNA polymerase sigma factor FecI n=1 Tax=Pseudomonas reidholzensis TaxID=1785162 RepID=A0A383RRC6_9PSED|nr:sigma-70 family RNA polymerase sigma factor [Pseudomonas reidholzensis]SYX89011.1 putative RNA polymerase sigma factor FecI [Pseudomonas reidholzensis]